MDMIKRNLFTSPEALFISDYDELKRKIKALKELGLKIVMTQGVWDMFHTGHTRYFREAKARGDVLVVAIDDDDLTKKRKGPDRPFDPESERFEVVRSVRTVDIVTVKRATDHKFDVIDVVEPDVLVVSMSTGPEVQNDLEELRKHCGELVNLPRQSSTSTTAKFRKLKIDVGKTLKDRLNKVVEDFLENPNQEAK